MDPIKDAEDVLKAIENAVIQLATGHPEMNNYTVGRAYDAAIEHYLEIARQHTPREVRLNGLDALTSAAVREAWEQRLGKPLSDAQPSPALAPADLLICLRKLRKSVDFWTKQGGRTGYLDHVSQYIFSFSTACLRVPESIL
jgi:hypothetical protein